MEKKTVKKSKPAGKKSGVKGKGQGKEQGKEKEEVEKTPEGVRKALEKLVLNAAEDITKAVIGEGKKGQLATAKYIFEMAKIYPKVNDGSEATKDEDCLAKTLLDRLNIPDKPVVADEDEEFVTIPPRPVEEPETQKAEEEKEEEVVVG